MPRANPPETHQRLLGVTGLPAAGKGTVVEMVSDALLRHGVTVSYFSLSDELRELAIQRGETVQRPTLRRIAHEIRRAEGGGALAGLLAKKIDESGILERAHPQLIIIDAIRNSGEVLYLRQKYGKRFLLVAVVAPLEALVERLSTRKRHDEALETLNRPDMAESMIRSEMGEGEPAYGHDIERCIDIADIVIDNSIDDPASIADQVSLLVAQLHLAST